MILTFLDALSLSVPYHGKLAHITGIGTMHLHALHLVFPSSLPLYGARSGHLCEYHNPFFPLLDTYPNCTHNFNPAGKKAINARIGNDTRNDC